MWRMNIRVIAVMMVLSTACTSGEVGSDLTAAGTGTETTAPTSPVGGTLTPTPTQPEGPFYPLNKPSDRDNDLSEIDGQSGVAGGQVLIMSGLLMDTTGDPIQGATIEIWQTDENGIYLHPDDSDVDDRDPAFQGYGESITQSDGSWDFRTIDPGYYEPRLRHIHLKVLIDDEEVLISQIYFSDDPDAAELDPSLIAMVALNDDGTTLMAEHRLVIDR